jgi:hypothetical protein
MAEWSRQLSLWQGDRCRSKQGVVGSNPKNFPKENSNINDLIKKNKKNLSLSHNRSLSLYPSLSFSLSIPLTVSLSPSLSNPLSVSFSLSLAVFLSFMVCQ